MAMITLTLSNFDLDPDKFQKKKTYLRTLMVIIHKRQREIYLEEGFERISHNKESKA